ncbi:MAG: RNA exonuclease 3 [Caeruleum heppii]|nr:MAG: RNA exonuclease 3 [Caeruleum heppii]
MFSSLHLFSQIACPKAESCTLPNCLFSHNVSVQDVQSKSSTVSSDTAPRHPALRDQLEADGDGPRKRRRLSTQEDESTATRSAAEGERAAKHEVDRPTRRETTPATAKRPISPPPLRTRPVPASTTKEASRTPAKAALRATETKPSHAPAPKAALPAESLNPRLLSKPPASHAFRTTVLSKIHDEFVRLNAENATSSDPPSGTHRPLSEQDLVKMALDEEERIALDQPVVYSNVIKQRLMRYKKMALPAWREHVLTLFPNTEPPKNEEAAVPAIQSNGTTPKELTTGLTTPEELSLLPRLLAPATELQKHGYTTTAPTEAEIGAARAGVEASQGWEVCDRCSTRFQVFPGRREEDGALASGGRCTYHWGKPYSASRDSGGKSSKATGGNKEKMYSCCSEPLGSSSSLGCVTATHHVYRFSSAPRLASLLPFIATPPNPEIPPADPPDHAVSLDCEMCYTVHGLEVVRVSATSWPDGAVLLDALVRPQGEILDLNSRFSGVWPEDLTTAPAYTSSLPSSSPLALLPNPSTARILLFTHLTPTTPLLGHGLENDLACLRILHPSVIDTAFLFPHPRGLPFRNGLKFLVRRFLGREIQGEHVTGGGEEGKKGGAVRGHDSVEDARAAGELVRVAVGREWKVLKRKGWTRVDEIEWVGVRPPGGAV